MVQFEELLLKLQALKPEIDDLSDALGMKGMLSEIQQLELKATEPGFWDDVQEDHPIRRKRHPDQNKRLYHKMPDFGTMWKNHKRFYSVRAL